MKRVEQRIPAGYPSHLSWEVVRENYSIKGETDDGLARDFEHVEYIREYIVHTAYVDYVFKPSELEDAKALYARIERIRAWQARKKEKAATIAWMNQEIGNAAARISRYRMLDILGRDAAAHLADPAAEARVLNVYLREALEVDEEGRLHERRLKGHGRDLRPASPVFRTLRWEPEEGAEQVATSDGSRLYIDYEDRVVYMPPAPPPPEEKEEPKGFNPFGDLL